MPVQKPTIGTAADYQQAFRRAFGRRLQKLLLEKGWNQSDLARYADVGRDAISTYVNGKSFPEPLNRKRLADALGITVEQLMPDDVAPGADDQGAGVRLRLADELGKAYLTISEPIPLAVAAEIIDLIKAAKEE